MNKEITERLDQIADKIELTTRHVVSTLEAQVIVEYLYQLTITVFFTVVLILIARYVLKQYKKTTNDNKFDYDGWGFEGFKLPMSIIIIITVALFVSISIFELIWIATTIIFNPDYLPFIKILK